MEVLPVIQSLDDTVLCRVVTFNKIWQSYAKSYSIVQFSTHPILDGNPTGNLILSDNLAFFPTILGIPMDEKW